MRPNGTLASKKASCGSGGKTVTEVRSSAFSELRYSSRTKRRIKKKREGTEGAPESLPLHFSPFRPLLRSSSTPPDHENRLSPRDCRPHSDLRSVASSGSSGDHTARRRTELLVRQYDCRATFGASADQGRSAPAATVRRTGLRKYAVRDRAIRRPARRPGSLYRSRRPTAARGRSAPGDVQRKILSNRDCLSARGPKDDIPFLDQRGSWSHGQLLALKSDLQALASLTHSPLASGRS